jgi:hypothetical protein
MNITGMSTMAPPTRLAQIGKRAAKTSVEAA